MSRVRPRCWILELRYATEGGSKRKQMLSAPMTYSAARELCDYWTNRGVKTRLIEVGSPEYQAIKLAEALMKQRKIR